MDKFLKCLPIILEYEGGFVDHKLDPGGATNMGITHRTLSSWRKKPVTKEDVKNLTKEEAGRIYKSLYWDKCHCDGLSLTVALVVFDGAVNSGVSRSSKWLQKCCGAVQDGIIGKKTISLANSINQTKLAMDILDGRLSFLQKLDTWPTFGKGWGNRISKLRKKVMDETWK